MNLLSLLLVGVMNMFALWVQLCAYIIFVSYVWIIIIITGGVPFFSTRERQTMTIAGSVREIARTMIYLQIRLMVISIIGQWTRRINGFDGALNAMKHLIPSN